MTMRFHAMIGRYDCSSRLYTRLNYIGLLGSPVVCPTTRVLPHNNSRLGDIFLPLRNWAQPAALDVTVYSPLTSISIRNAAERSAFSLSAAQEKKYERFAQKCSEIGIQLNLLAIEGYSESFRKIIEEVAVLAVNRSLLGYI